MGELRQPGSHDDGFRAGVDAALTPWLIWAAHFAACYVWLAVGCMPALAGRSVFGVSLAAAGLAFASITAIAALLWRLRRSVRAITARGAGSAMQADLSLASTALALLAVAWTALPMLLVTACAG